MHYSISRRCRQSPTFPRHLLLESFYSWSISGLGERLILSVIGGKFWHPGECDALLLAPVLHPCRFKLLTKGLESCTFTISPQRLSYTHSMSASTHFLSCLRLPILLAAPKCSTSKLQCAQKSPTASWLSRFLGPTSSDPDFISLECSL